MFFGPFGFIDRTAEDVTGNMMKGPQGRTQTRVHCSEDKASEHGMPVLPSELNGAPINSNLCWKCQRSPFLPSICYMTPLEDNSGIYEPLVGKDWVYSGQNPKYITFEWRIFSDHVWHRSGHKDKMSKSPELTKRSCIMTSTASYEHTLNRMSDATYTKAQLGDLLWTRITLTDKPAV